MSIGTNIKSIREKFNLSRKEFAEKAHLLEETITLWEEDKGIPTLENLLLLKRFLGVSIDEVFSETEVVANTKNPNSLDTVCGALAYAIGVENPKNSANPNVDLCSFIDKAFNGEKVDRIVMYNPDAIGEWIYKKYKPALCSV